MYTNAMNESLQLNVRFAGSLSDNQLDDLMKEFDNYEIERCKSGFYSQQSSRDYWRALFELVGKEKKSINLEDNSKDPNKVLTYLN